jgi:hypothetical protein
MLAGGLVLLALPARAVEMAASASPIPRSHGPIPPTRTPTPSATPTPSPTLALTGDLGVREVYGIVYDAARGLGTPIAQASVRYRQTSPPEAQASGAVMTDAEGQYRFALFVRDTDVVSLRVEAPGYLPTDSLQSGLDLWWAIGDGSVPINLGLHRSGSTRNTRILGHVARNSFTCGDDWSGVSLVLRPTEQTTTTLSDGTFAFEGVEDGDYVLTLPPSQPSSVELDCDPLAESVCIPVSVRGHNVSVDLCPRECWPHRVDIVPTAGDEGTEIEVSGRCSWIHSGGRADVYFDATRIGSATGDTLGDYRATVSVPAPAQPGPHVVRVLLAGGSEIAAATFAVRSSDAGGGGSGGCAIGQRPGRADACVFAFLLPVALWVVIRTRRLTTFADSVRQPDLSLDVTERISHGGTEKRRGAAREMTFRHLRNRPVQDS